MDNFHLFIFQYVFIFFWNIEKRLFLLFLIQFFGLMNFFKGEFKIGQSWDKQSPRNALSREKSRQKSRDKNRPFQNVAKNIINQSIPDILDHQTAKYIIKEFNAEIPPSPMPSIKSEKKIAVKDQNMRLPPKQKNILGQGQNDLLTSMAARLKTVQMTNKNLKEQLKQKNVIVEKFKAENIFLKGFRQDASKQYEKMQTITKKNQQLQKKVNEMQAYLKKYGLKWVGDKIEGKLDQQNLKKAIQKGNYQYRLPKQIDINTITRRIEELNGGLHSEGMGTQIYNENGIHKFRKAQPLPIGFFANGIAIKGYKFFSYKTKQSLQILGDLVDGYFPYVLKGKYPNGVFLKVVDKLIEQYNSQNSQDHITSFQSNQAKDFKPPSKEQFLSKLPKNIMKNGKIIPIRDAIQKRMNGMAQKQIKETAEQEQNEEYQRQQGITIFKTKEKQQIETHQIQEQSVCMLKIRNEEGDIFILKLGRQKKMRDVYSWMRKVLKKPFKIMGNFPRRTYQQDQTQNLQSLGLWPNAMLHAQTNLVK